MISESKPETKRLTRAIARNFSVSNDARIVVRVGVRQHCLLFMTKADKYVIQLTKVIIVHGQRALAVPETNIDFQAQQVRHIPFQGQRVGIP